MSGNWVFDEPSLRDFFSLVLFHAPDEFPVEDYLDADEQLNLDRAFDELRCGLQFAKALKDSSQVLQASSLLDRAYAAYVKRQLPEASAVIRELERYLGFAPGPGGEDRE